MIAAKKTFVYCLFALGLALAGAPRISAQAIGDSGPGPVAKENEEKGFTLVGSFAGSSNTYGQVMNFTSAAGYAFNKHFSFDVGVPVDFDRVTTTTSTATMTTTYSGIGDAFLELHFAFKNPGLSYASTTTAAAPTGDKSKGLSTGHMTADWSNTLFHDFGTVSPYVTAGVANSIPNTQTFQRPYLTQGMLAHFEEGLAVNLGHSVSISGLAYQIAPWGNQTVVSRVATPASGASAVPVHTPVSIPVSTPTSIQQNAVTTGSSSLTSDKGFGASLDYNLTKYLGLGVGFSHSVNLSLNTVSFGVTFNLSPLLRGI